MLYSRQDHKMTHRMLSMGVKFKKPLDENLKAF